MARLAPPWCDAAPGGERDEEERRGEEDEVSCSDSQSCSDQVQACSSCSLHFSLVLSDRRSRPVWPSSSSDLRRHSGGRLVWCHGEEDVLPAVEMDVLPRVARGDQHRITRGHAGGRTGGLRRRVRLRDAADRLETDHQHLWSLRAVTHAAEWLSLALHLLSADKQTFFCLHYIHKC